MLGELPLVAGARLRPELEDLTIHPSREAKAELGPEPQVEPVVHVPVILAAKTQHHARVKPELERWHRASAHGEDIHLEPPPRGVPADGQAPAPVKPREKAGAQ